MNLIEKLQKTQQAQQETFDKLEAVITMSPKDYKQKFESPNNTKKD